MHLVPGAYVNTFAHVQTLVISMYDQTFAQGMRKVYACTGKSKFAYMQIYIRV